MTESGSAGTKFRNGDCNRTHACTGRFWQSSPNQEGSLSLKLLLTQLPKTSQQGTEQFAGLPLFKIQRSRCGKTTLTGEKKKYHRSPCKHAAFSQEKYNV
jgi:hypothetical protein